jgi:hypothetical protein
MYNPLQRIARERIAQRRSIAIFVIRLYKDMFMIWELQWKVELADTQEFSNSMDVAKIQLYLQKEIMEIDNISLKKHSMTLILLFFALKVIEGE